MSAPDLPHSPYLYCEWASPKERKCSTMFTEEHMRAYAAAAVLAERERVMAPLFDGNAVFARLDEKALRRTSADNVSDVLDSVVRIIRAEPKEQQP